MKIKGLVHNQNILHIPVIQSMTFIMICFMKPKHHFSNFICNDKKILKPKHILNIIVV